MTITFDVYRQDPCDNGDPEYITTIEREDNPTHILHFLAGYCNESNNHIIRNMRIYP
jgi:hypothetical protein